MRVLLDEQLPVDLATQLHGHSVHTVASRGWAGIKNGELLARMRGHYDVLVTMDNASSSNKTRRPYRSVSSSFARNPTACKT